MKKATLILSFLLIIAKLVATTYEVGPGKPYTHIYDVPLKNLQAGDIIKVYAKSEPYNEKFMIYGTGTELNPIQLIGVPDAQGNKPVLDGQNAVSGTALGNYFWNEDRSILKVGQSGNEAHYIIIDGFEIKNANRNYTFFDDQGNLTNYISNAAGIHIERGYNVTIKNCHIHHNENGIQSSNNGTSEITLESCYIHENGVGSPSSAYQHNLYMDGGAGTKVTIQYCKFGELLNDGQQIKFRTESIVFRYNWIEGGRNGQMDIVDREGNGNVDSYVYGNIIIKPENTNNGRLIHYGQDNNNHNGGTLHFFNNTIINKSNKIVYLLRLSSNNRTAIASNNIFYKTTQNNVNLIDSNTDPAKISGSNNWFYEGTENTELLTNSIQGNNPQFTNVNANNFTLQSNSPAKDIVTSFTFPANHPLNKEYVTDLQWRNRPVDNALDLGAYEYSITSAAQNVTKSKIKIYPNPAGNTIIIDSPTTQVMFIYNMQGQLQKTTILQTGINKINVTELVVGNYILKIGTQISKIEKR